MMNSVYKSATGESYIYESPEEDILSIVMSNYNMTRKEATQYLKRFREQHDITKPI